MKHITIVCAGLLFCNYVIAQIEKIYLSREGLNFLVNSKLASLVSGQPTGTAVANFASFEPVNGTFTFKGSVPLSRKADSSRFAFLTIRLEGDLISESYAALFRNSELNTGTVADVQLHFRFSRDIKRFSYLATHAATLDLQRTMLGNERTRGLAKASTAGNWANYISGELARNQFNLDVIRFKIADNVLKQTAKATTISTELAKLVPDAQVIKTNSEDLAKLETEEAGFRTEEKKLFKSIDSLTIVQADLAGFRQKYINSINKKTADSIEKLEHNAVLTGVRFTWFTLIGGGSKKNFYLFNESLPFNDQIEKKEFNTFRIGLSINFYNERSFPTKAFYGNIGFLRYKDNNIKLLSTMEVAQQKVIKNSTGDIIRTITKKYNSYTDPIIESTVWNIFSNAYFIHSSKSMALHLFPGIELVDNAKDLTNLGVGYVVSFKTEKKERPVLNAEGYIKFVDLFNNLDGRARFWNRNEIGISITLPFNFLIP